MSGTNLVVEGLSTGYGKMRIVTDVSFKVGSGELVAVLGRNGAGKTTSLLTVAGIRYGPTSGRLILDGKDILGAKTRSNVREGLVAVPEGHRVFKGLTVRENLVVGTYAARTGRSMKKLTDHVFELFPILSTYADIQASYLSGGEQQMLAIGQALMAQPRILILDEPTSGLSPFVSTKIFEVISELRARGLGVVMVEQDVEHAMDVADRWYVIDGGVTCLSGDATTTDERSRAADVVRGVNQLEEEAVDDRA